MSSTTNNPPVGSTSGAKTGSKFSQIKKATEHLRQGVNNFADEAIQPPASRRTEPQTHGNTGPTTAPYGGPGNTSTAPYGGPAGTSTVGSNTHAGTPGNAHGSGLSSGPGTHMTPGTNTTSGTHNTSGTHAIPGAHNTSGTHTTPGTHNAAGTHAIPGAHNTSGTQATSGAPINPGAHTGPSTGTGTSATPASGPTQQFADGTPGFRSGRTAQAHQPTHEPHTQTTSTTGGPSSALKEDAKRLGKDLKAAMPGGGNTSSTTHTRGT